MFSPRMIFLRIFTEPLRTIICNMQKYFSNNSAVQWLFQSNLFCKIKSEFFGYFEQRKFVKRPPQRSKKAKGTIIIQD
ncbi:unnamed protein product [Tenebrio molitor]|nr:unnamed protein product [Tenebrio molitor]